MISEQDQIFLNRTIHLAALAGNQTGLNPRVGAVCVKNNQIIGEGYHTKYGAPHAEPEALARVRNQEDIQGSTLYVSLEPCNHFGKTPPCTELIIRTGVKRVVIGMQDPNEQVNGSGIQRLTDAGIQVDVVPDSSPFQALIREFILNQKQKRAYSVLKWAEDAAGIMGDRHSRKLISGPQARIFTHKLRAENQAVLIGADTAMQDNPSLNCRDFPGNDPVRIVLDPSGKVPASLKLFSLPGTSLHLTRLNTPQSCFENMNMLLEHLFQMYKISSVLIEGGSYVLQKCIQNQAWDEIYVIRAPHALSSLQSPVPAPRMQNPGAFIQNLNSDRLYFYGPDSYRRGLRNCL